MSEKAKYFPLFMDISRRRLFFIGGGSIAARRIQGLSEFVARITVIAPEVCEEILKLSYLEENEIEIIYENYDVKWLQDANRNRDIVFACTNDVTLNHTIYQDCKRLGILVNNCSDKEECDFYFPGIIKRDNIVIGVSSGGKAHKKVKQTREKIEELL